MNRLVLNAAVATALAMIAAPALAGGRGAVVCPTGYVAARDAQKRAICVAGSRTESVVVTAGTVIETRGRRGVNVFCPYPHRPSDTAFSGGSGYIIKDDVRRAMGCY